MAIQRGTGGKFLPGSGGRPAGVRNRLQSDFIEALQKDFAENGADTIKIVRVEKPADYLKIIASTLPKEFSITDDTLANLSDEEILTYWRAVRAAGPSADKTEH